MLTPLQAAKVTLAEWLNQFTMNASSARLSLRDMVQHCFPSATNTEIGVIASDAEREKQKLIEKNTKILTTPVDKY